MMLRQSTVYLLHFFPYEINRCPDLNTVKMNYFLKGFIYAYNGLVIFFRNERNGRIQLFIAVFVVLAGLILSVSLWEWIILLICIASVISLEMINSAIEKVCNLIQPQYHPAVKVIKDIAAGAVLWCSLISGVIGIIIFLPKLIHLFT